MEKKKKETILILALVPILGYVVYANLIGGKKPVPPPATPEGKTAATAPVRAPAPGPAAPVPVRPLDQREFRERSAVSGGEWGRNPFLPVSLPPGEAGDSPPAAEFKLSSVIPPRIAIINGQDLEVGEVYRGYELIEVKETAVRLGRGGEIYILSMPEE